MAENISEKLLKALDCLLLENFIVQDKTLLEKLLSSLIVDDTVLKKIALSVHTNWLSKVLDICEKQSDKSEFVVRNLYSFALKYMAILVRSKDNFEMMMHSNIIQLMIKQVNNTNILKDSLIFNSYIFLLKILNIHKQGIIFVNEEYLWSKNLFINDANFVMGKFMELQNIQYISEFIYKSFELDVVNCSKNILNHIFFELKNVDHILKKNEIKLYNNFNFYAKILIFTLERFLGTEYQPKAYEVIIVNYVFKDILIKMNKLIKLAPFLSKSYITLHLLFDCYTIWPSLDTRSILKSNFVYLDWPNDLQFYKQVNNWYIQAIKYMNIMKLNKTDLFEKQLIFDQLRYLEEFIKYTSKKICDTENNIDYNYITKCNEFVCDPKSIKEMTISALFNTIDVLHLLKQETLNCLNELFSNFMDLLIQKNLWFEKNQNFSEIHKYQDILEVIPYVFLCWTKLLEVQSLQKIISIPSTFIKSQNQYIQKSRDLILLQNILKFTCTTLKLLNYSESIINLDDFNDLFKTLSILLLDRRSEIRDSCLECLSNIKQVSAKYDTVSFILENQLPVAVYNTAKHDNDSFVKAKAIECLSNMVAISEVGTMLLNKTDLLEFCLDTMQWEPEGVIRRQAVKLITTFYNFNYLSESVFNEICVVMVHVSIKDPLWEVKKFTYDFWSCVVCKLTKETSYSENSNELYDFIKLGEVGCLHVLHTALNDECDLEVQKSAICISKKLLNSSIFISNTKQPIYNNSIQHNQEDHKTNSLYFNKVKKVRQFDSSDRVLNSISCSCDNELLPILKNSSNGNIYPQEFSLRLKTDDYISPNQFFDFISAYDFDNYNTKKQWLIDTRSGLNSMLDDVIGQSHNIFIEGADLLDCY
ncbi:uncharacterized protein LOC126903935 [Daktulosphaira vitifoliae]|uniref:uncharacterized protein LOC126903935 n=1 Tax=Daktulosphaira vitifoliae TaxID=58002 RepID=UPI0021AAFDC6|nr:uncharacterized protein LOC126903935 [Daktulosphaira vitifoliae]